MIECVNCGESKAAIQASQRRGDPLYCVTVGWDGEVREEFSRHRFRDYTDKELAYVLPEYRHLYRREWPMFAPCEHLGCEHKYGTEPGFVGVCVKCFTKQKQGDCNV